MDTISNTNWQSEGSKIYNPTKRKKVAGKSKNNTATTKMAQERQGKQKEEEEKSDVLRLMGIKKDYRPGI